jgi:prepilin-type N-terminal cleavage/methylation domain-containing protein
MEYLDHAKIMSKSKQRHRHPKRVSRQGFTLVEVMAVTGLVSIVALALTSLLQMTQKAQSQSNLTFQAATLRNNMVTVLNTATGWANTYSDTNNPGMTCVGQSNCPSPGNPVYFYQILDGSGNKVFTGGGSNGVTPQGVACNTFSSVPGQGSDFCPLSFTLTWTPVCNGGTCSPTPVNTYAGTLINITAVYNPATAAARVAFNPYNYSAQFYQGSTGLGCSWLNVGSSPTQYLYETCASDVGIGMNNPINSDPAATAPALNVAGDMITNSGHLVTNNSSGSLFLDAGPNVTASPMPGIYFNSDSAVGNRNPATATTLMFVGLNGYVGIGTTSPQYSLDVGGTGSTSTIHAGGLLLTSDEREKNQIKDLSGTESLSRLSRVKPVSFDWKKNHEPDLGIIAQQLEKIYPELVKKDKSGVESVKYISLIAPMISAIQELKARSETLEAKNAELTQELKDLKKAISAGPSPASLKEKRSGSP